MINLRSTVV